MPTKPVSPELLERLAKGREALRKKGLKRKGNRQSVKNWQGTEAKSPFVKEKKKSSNPLIRALVDALDCDKHNMYMGDGIGDNKTMVTIVAQNPPHFMTTSTRRVPLSGVSPYRAKI